MIDVKKFTLLGARGIARDAVPLVADNREWLDEVRPGVTAGYATKKTALGRILAITRSKEPNAYLLRDRTKGVAVGIATVIRDQTIRWNGIHGEARLTGFDIDFWLGETAVRTLKPYEHGEIVEQLVYAERVQPGDVVFAALTEAELERAPGIARSLRPLGVPTVIEEQSGSTFNLAKSGASVQIYTSI